MILPMPLNCDTDHDKPVSRREALEGADTFAADQLIPSRVSHAFLDGGRATDDRPRYPNTALEFGGLPDPEACINEETWHGGVGARGDPAAGQALQPRDRCLTVRLFRNKV